MTGESFSDIQRQFTRYLRDPSRAPLPAGADRRSMDFYARHYRKKLHRFLEGRWPVLAAVLGRDALSDLIDRYVRLPRESLGGKSSFDEAFLHYVEEQCATLGLAPFVAELANFSMQAAQIFYSPLEIGDDDLEGDGDLLGRVPVFSPWARLLEYNWPVHRINADFFPPTGPAPITRLILYRDRRDHAGWIELNAWAAEIARQVRDNAVGRTGRELLTDSQVRHPFLDRHCLVREGQAILEEFRRRDIVTWVRKGMPAPRPT